MYVKTRQFCKLFSLKVTKIQNSSGKNDSSDVPAQLPLGFRDRNVLPVIKYCSIQVLDFGILVGKFLIIASVFFSVMVKIFLFETNQY